MGKLITRLFTLIGFLTVLGLGAIAVAVAILWWQDRQWQAKSGQDDE